MHWRGTSLLIAVALGGVAIGLLLAANRTDETQAGGYYPGQATALAVPDGITVTGIGHARVHKPAMQSDRTIRAAVASAQRVAYPRAATDARVRADLVAQSLGLHVGGVESVAESTDTYSSGSSGRFGTGRYCGTLGRSIVAYRGGRRVVRRVVHRHRCVVPRASVISLTVRYERG
jgi:hypothetical protein